jgi:hypothetical protein
MPDVTQRDFERFMRGELKDPRLIGMMTLMLQGFSHRDAVKLLKAAAMTRRR